MAARTGTSRPDGGKFYRTYDKEAAVPFEDDSVRERFETKRDADMAEITDRMAQVEIERSYRVVGLLEKLAKRIEHEVLPTISREKASIKRKVLWGDGITFGLLGAALVTLTVMAGYWDGFTFAPPWWDGILADPILSGLMLAVLVGVFGYVHYLGEKICCEVHAQTPRCTCDHRIRRVDSQRHASQHQKLAHCVDHRPCRLGSVVSTSYCLGSS